MPSGAARDRGSAATQARQLATPIEVASYLQVPVKTLYTWRYKRVGPRAHRVGHHIRYRWEDVEAWLTSRADQLE
jgi:excisionase family DNA binding protein